MLVLALVAATALTPTEQGAVFAAAGFAWRGGQWHSDCEDPGTPSYEPGAIETAADLNGDGRPEAVVTEGGSYCYGNTGTGFSLLSKQADGHWKRLYQSPGVAEFLKTRGVEKMPDISVGGPGFCFLVVRWNGKAYVDNRFEYEGKACRLNK